MPTIAYLFEPRFPGGTSAAFASELRVATGVARVTVHAMQQSVFGKRAPNANLMRTLAELGIEIRWDSPTVAADLVVVHNPSFLKRHAELHTRIVARHVIVVAHENFLRPGGAESFDVAHCLDLIDRSSLALRKSVAPVSGYCRETVTAWFAGHPGRSAWQVLPEDWFNVLDFDHVAPNPTPADRRGRHSRPGLEKFPGLDALDLCFPAHASANVLLGADALIGMDLNRPHWSLLPFGSVPVAQFFEMIDFLVYFTAPTWRESFGRVIAEAIAAGKVVLTDRANTAVFGDLVIGCAPHEVDAIIAAHIRDPRKYARQAARAQAGLSRFGPPAFGSVLARAFEGLEARA